MARISKLLLVIALTGLALSSVCTSSMAQMKNQGVSSADSDFATQASEANQGEIVLAKLALQKTSSPAVRMFAQRMITDHSKAGQELQTIASKDHLRVSDSLMPTDQQTQQTLDSLSGHPFDVAYMRSQIADHEAAISLFQKEARDGTNPSLIQFASTTLPILQEHLKLAQQAQEQVGS